ncbi:MAG TPA: pitrilysin family protein [Saprospiraceae bacterium]|nr:pitrilysin family protein [Saprospiraceae bacterium]
MIKYTDTINDIIIPFEEYDLENGLHVILHRDNTAPLVAVSMMYHVGSKNENPEMTGFAHFFEHLLFEGSENIPRGQFFNIVQNAGGTMNANTSNDRTFYYELFPSNHLETGLWLESERLLHAKVDQTGIETQRSVVKEERRQRYDNRPYGTLVEEGMKRVFKSHPYNWSVIGSMDHIDAAQEHDYKHFYDTYYVPNNAVLCISGDFEVNETKELIHKYFGLIPKGENEVFRPDIIEPDLENELRDTIFDNVQLPAVVHIYRIPGYAIGDYFAVKLLSDMLSGGASSRLHKALVDEQQKAVYTGSFPFDLEHPGVVLQFAIGNMGISVDELEKAMDDEVISIQNQLMDEREFQKLMNQTETQLVYEKSSLLEIAEGLSTHYTYFKNTSMYNEQLQHFTAVTREDIQKVAKKYFKKENRVALHWLPKLEEETAI